MELTSVRFGYSIAVQRRVSMDKDEPIRLSDLIEDLREELQRAAARGTGQALVFEIEKAELEAKVLVSRTGSADGKVQFWVVSAGGGYEKKGEETHTVTLTLLPKSATSGKRINVSGETTVQPDPN
jgi:hypothetical protein